MVQKTIAGLTIKDLGDGGLEGVTSNGLYFVISQMDDYLLADLFNDAIEDNDESYVETIQNNGESIDGFIEDIKGYVLNTESKA
ncbi:MAG: hypothetical protein SFU55_01440 [Methylophilus sp.]|nr:hypothetical protein [Methylophilus sp.]